MSRRVLRQLNLSRKLILLKYKGVKVLRQEINVMDNQVVVKLFGSMYVEEAALLRDSLIKYIEQGYKNFVIDVGGVDYIDSSGLGVLVAIQKRALQKAGGVTICNLGGMVKELFELTRLTKVFKIQ